jgi:hypothetical protein
MALTLNNNVKTIQAGQYTWMKYQSAGASNVGIFNKPGPVETVLSCSYGAQSAWLKNNESKTSGKWYWEINLTGRTSDNQYGICSPSCQTAAHYEGNQMAGVYDTSALWMMGGTSGTVSAGSAFVNNDVIGMALDMDDGTLKVYQNNTLRATISGIKTYISEAFAFVSGTCSVNFGSSSFVYTPPSGYSAYSATAGFVVELPTSPATTADGFFKAVCVGEDSQGRKLLIPDRNLQHTIAWNALNTDGVASGSGVELSSLYKPEKIFNTTSSFAVDAGNNATTMSPDGTYIFRGTSASSSYEIWKRNGTTYTKLTNPLDTPHDGGIGDARFSYDGNYLAIANFYGTGQKLLIYKRNGDSFTKLNTVPSITSSVLNLKWGEDGTLAYSFNSAEVYVLSKSGDTFSARMTIASPGLGNCYDMCISPNGQYLAATYLNGQRIYKLTGGSSSSIFSNALYAGGSLEFVDNQHVIYSSEGTLYVFRITNDVGANVTQTATITEAGRPTYFRNSNGTFVYLPSNGLYALNSNGVLAKLWSPVYTSSGSAPIFSSDGTYLFIHTSTSAFSVFKQLDFSKDVLKIYVRLLSKLEFGSYLRTSTLGGVITANDTSVWNHSSNTWLSTVHSTTTNRLYGNSSGNSSGIAATTANATYGFRPMIVVETAAGTSFTNKLFAGEVEIAKIYVGETEIVNLILPSSP